MTASRNAGRQTTDGHELTLLKGLLLAVPACAGLAQLTVWILDYHGADQRIRWVLASAIFASLIGVIVSAAAVGYRPKDKVLWYSLILNAFVAVQGMLLILMAYIVVLNLLRGR